MKASILCILAALATVGCQQQQQADSIVCTNNVKQIFLACIMYADDHEGNLPTNLDATLPYLGVVSTNGTVPDLLLCPAAQDRTVPSYKLMPLGNVSAVKYPGTTILIDETIPRHSGGRVVGYADGLCRTIPTQQ